MWIIYQLDSLPNVAKKSVALMVLAVISLIIVFSIILPVQRHFQTMSETVDLRYDLYKRYAKISSRSDQLDKLTDSELINPVDRGFLIGKKDALLLADLQDRLAKIIVGAGAQLQSSRIVGTDQYKNLTWIGIRVDFNSTTRSLQKLVTKIENSNQPILIVRKARLRANQNRQLNAKTIGPVMSISMDIYAPKWEVKKK